MTTEPLYRYRESYHRTRLKKLGCSKSFAELLEQQNSRCKICGAESGNLVIDHCHKSKIVRGLLCYPCNHGLGSFKDNPILLLNAVSYLLSSAKGKAPKRSAGIRKVTWKNKDGTQSHRWVAQYRDIHNKRRHKNFSSLKKAKEFIDSLESLDGKGVLQTEPISKSTN